MKQSEGRRLISLPSIAGVFFLSVFIYLSLYAGKGLLADGDTGYHIRAGEYIIDTLSIPKQDIFSFISPPLQWTAHEWLSEVIMAMVHKRAGLTGVTLFFAFIIAMVYYVQFRFLRKGKHDILLASFIMVLVVASSQIHWLARPHIFTLLLLVFWYHILDLYQYEGRNLLYLLPLVMLPWANLHGGFMSGFILLAVYLAGNLMQYVFARGEEKKIFWHKTRAYALTAAASLVAALANPYGWHILAFPFRLTSNRFIMDNVHEFLSPNFHEPMTFTFLLLLTVAALSRSGRKLNIIEIMLLLLFTYMALYSARYIPLFSIIIAPVLLRQLGAVSVKNGNRFFAFLKRRSERIDRMDSASGSLLWIAGAVAAVVFLAASHRLEYGFDSKIKPVDAVEFLKKEKINGAMFNNDEFGDYIIYAAWPQYKVFFDGRSDMYGTERMKEYFKITRIEPGWEDTLKKYDINWIIYNDKSTLSQFLLQRDDWKLIYSDKVANIFMKNTSENQKWIEKHKDARPDDK